MGPPPPSTSTACGRTMRGMAEPSPADRRMPGLGGYGATVVLVGAWLLSFFLGGSRRWRLHEGISDAIYRILSGFPGAQQVVHRLFQSLWVFVGGTYALSLG